MKIFLPLLLAAGLLRASAQPTLLTTNWTGGFVNAGVIPDNDLNGWLDSRVITDIPAQNVDSLEVTLNLSGGFTGDIYAYLWHDGIMSILLDRVGTPANAGFGYLDNGFNVTLSDAASSSLHNYQDYNPAYNNGSVTGTWQPDGSSLSAFQGTALDGTWTLFVADESSGGVMTVNSWGLNIAATPEPSAVALSVVGITSLLLFRQRRRTRTVVTL
jgi:subtilisin-like proprotein convertase family protein